MRPPRAATRSAAKRRKVSEGSPRQRMSLGGKCVPMSPSASAPSSASVQHMQPGIGVRMPLELFVVRDGDAAKGHSIALDEGVNVIAVADPRLHVARPFQNLRRTVEIAGQGDLDVVRAAMRERHWHATPFGDCRVVGEAIGHRMCPPVQVENDRIGKALRRLGGKKLGAVFGTPDRASVRGALDRVDHRRRRQHRIGSFERLDDAVDHGGRHDRPCAVVNEHQIRLGCGQRLKAPEDRRLARGAARHRRQDLAGRIGGKRRIERPVLGADDHQHDIDGNMVRIGGDRP